MTLIDTVRIEGDDAETISLGKTAHTLLMGFRMIVVGRGECRMLRQMFVDLCGPEGDEALTILFVVVKQLAFRGRRRLAVHAPGCSGISSDELIFLSALAAAQQPEIDGQGRERLWLSSLLAASADGAIAASLRSLASILASAGQNLDMEDWRPGARFQAPPRSLH